MKKITVLLADDHTIVREGFRKLDAGEMDAFELDELIHRYKRSTKELWKFCQITGIDAASARDHPVMASATVLR